MLFRSTAVRWIGLKCNVCGIATVSIDGGAATTVDTAGPAAPGSPGLTSDVVFTSPPLAAGSHTMVIINTGNTSSGGEAIGVDAFDVTSDGTSPPLAPPLTRFEETDPSVTFAGTWNSNTDFVAWSGGSAMVSNTTGSRATFTFTSTAVSWVSVKCDVCGIANVYVDGILKGTVDLYSSSSPPQQGAVFTVIGLSASSHTLAIEVTGTTTNPYMHAYIAVDAFDVTR